ncbi:unnamed protein product [Thelazia callipaeda]|uniref:Secreted protein n=1 Tax=Thelazia callipaeda TaxID=103827 RepID=A0A0N5D0X6_THECL|nr:unnamed protein product [Thelazia callipaeda]
MFYVVVVVVEQLTQLWPLLLFAFTSIAVCHLAAKYSKLYANNITTALTASHLFSDTTLKRSKSDDKAANAPQCCASRRASTFEVIHPPVTVINTCRGRNLLNKKEAPPSAIKESSESSQTIDDQDSDRVSLKEIGI